MELAFTHMMQCLWKSRSSICKTMMTPLQVPYATKTGWILRWDATKKGQHGQSMALLLLMLLVEHQQNGLFVEDAKRWSLCWGHQCLCVLLARTAVCVEQCMSVSITRRRHRHILAGSPSCMCTTIWLLFALLLYQSLASESADPHEHVLGQSNSVTHSCNHIRLEIMHSAQSNMSTVHADQHPPGCELQ